MSGPLVIARQGVAPPWSERLDGARLAGPDSLPEDLSDHDSAWIDAAALQPLDIARRLAAIDPTLQVAVVTPPEDRGLHERALLFTPGLGEVWLLSPDEVGVESLERADKVTRTRRNYKHSRGRMREMVATAGRKPRRVIISDAYLAKLLHVLPDPVVSVDENERIVSWSDAAEQCFGAPYPEAMGRPLQEVVKPEDPAALEEALGQAWEDTTRLEISLQGPDRSLIMDVVITPVHAGGVGVRVLVFRDVTRQRESLRLLEREVELRSRFYAAMSHEIRTPINAIMGYIELLRTGAGGEEKRDHYLDRSQRAAQHLMELVSDVLDLSKLESGGLDIQREPTSVEDVMHDLVVTLEPMARERDTPLQVRCDPDPPIIETDSRRLKQILMNLISNALKFGEQRPVRVQCRRLPERVEFEVRDEGKGIAPEDLERIWEEFVQVGDTGEGTGLGLPISQKLAEVLGGELLAESELGKGSTFRLRLPLSQPSGDGATLAPPPQRTR